MVLKYCDSARVIVDSYWVIGRRGCQQEEWWEGVYTLGGEGEGEGGGVGLATQPELGQVVDDHQQYRYRFNDSSDVIPSDETSQELGQTGAEGT